MGGDDQHFELKRAAYEPRGRASVPERINVLPGFRIRLTIPEVQADLPLSDLTRLMRAIDTVAYLSAAHPAPRLYIRRGKEHALREGPPNTHDLDIRAHSVAYGSPLTIQLHELWLGFAGATGVSAAALSAVIARQDEISRFATWFYKCLHPDERRASREVRKQERASELAHATHERITNEMTVMVRAEQFRRLKDDLERHPRAETNGFLSRRDLPDLEPLFDYDVEISESFSPQLPIPEDLARPGTSIEKTEPDE